MTDLTALAHLRTRVFSLTALLLLCLAFAGGALADPPAPPPGGNTTAGASPDLLRGLIVKVAATNDYKLLTPLIGADDGTTAALAKLLRDPQLTPRERFMASVALSYVRTPAALAALLANPPDPAPFVRQGLALALGCFRDETGEVRAALTQMATTDPWTYPDPKTGATHYLVRETAQRSLGRLESNQPLATPAATPPVIPGDVAAPAASPAAPPSADKGAGEPRAPTVASSPGDAAVATAATFLTDAALPAFPKRDTRLPFAPDDRQPFWRLTLASAVNGQDSYLCVAPASDRVIDYVAALPGPPLPDAIIPREEAHKIGLDFARRHLPDLFAEGGEVMVSPESKVASNGAYNFNLQRVQQGVRLPIKALVGVRAYDGKIVRWQLEQEPVVVALTPAVSQEQAQDMLTQQLSAKDITLVWLDGFLEAMKWKLEEKLIWRLTVEARGPHEAPNNICGIYEYYIDAADGRTLGTRRLNLDRELYELDIRKSGKQLPPWSRPDLLFADDRPAPSPDGQRILFLSTRPRKGWPEWLVSRGCGLFVANMDGSGLACLVREGASSPVWGPRASQIAYLTDDGIVVLDLENGDRVVLKPEKPWRYGRSVFLRDGRLVTTACRMEGATTLFVLDPSKPDGVPLTLPSTPDFATRHDALAIDAQGRIVYTMVTQTGLVAQEGDPRRRTEPYQLCRIDPAAAQPTEEVRAPYLPSGNEIALTPDGRVLVLGPLWDRSQLVDPASGAATKWTPPKAWQPDTARQSLASIQSMTYSPDGQSILFASRYFSGQQEEPAAVVIHACGLDGSNVRLITRPQRGIAPTFVFGATGKLAFE